MNVRFWRRSPRRSDSSTASSTADSSVISAVSPSDPWVDRMDRRAANFSRLAKISAWSVVGGILLEDWDIFGMAWKYHFPYLIREGAGGLIVAIAIALEIRFSSLEASAERKIRDRYALRVTELDLARAEIEQKNAKLQLEILDLRFRLEDRDLTADQQREIVSFLSPFMTMRLDVVTYEKTYEILRLANILADLARKAGWIVNHWIVNEAVAAKGVLVAINSDLLNVPDAEQAARILVNVLNERGVAAQYRSHRELIRPGTRLHLLSGNASDKAPILMVVGKKP